MAVICWLRSGPDRFEVSPTCRADEGGRHTLASPLPVGYRHRRLDVLVPRHYRLWLKRRQSATLAGSVAAKQDR